MLSEFRTKLTSVQVLERGDGDAPSRATNMIATVVQMGMYDMQNMI
jgi:hypothetical protein